MALQTALNFKGIDLPAAYVRVDRIFGGKCEGWNSVVGVYASAEAAADQPQLETYNQAQAAVYRTLDLLQRLRNFNSRCAGDARR
mgnify:CR=1 FL=1